MPPKAAAVEAFDDDTEVRFLPSVLHPCARRSADLAAPRRLLQFDLPPAPPASAPGAGPMGMHPDQMRAMEAMMRNMGMAGGAGPGAAGAGGASVDPAVPALMAGGSGSKSSGPVLTAEQKTWTTLYPIYFDAKRPYGKGCRRIAYDKASLFPQSKFILAALRSLHIQAVHEPDKTHPKDWSNPGRVRAKLFNEDWQSLHAVIKTKKQLIERVAEVIQDIPGAKPPPLPRLRELRDEIVDRRTKKATKDAAAPAAAPQSGASSRIPAEKDIHVSAPALDPIRTRLAMVRFPEALGMGGPQSRLPPNSRAAEFGVMNSNMLDPAAAAQMMGPNNPMAGMLGMMGGDDDDEDEDEQAPPPPPDPFANHWSKNLSRRQRKRTIRIGR